MFNVIYTFVIGIHHIFLNLERSNIMRKYSCVYCLFAAPPPLAAPTNPCQPSPCGPNAACQVAGESPSCSCLPDFTGSPPNCRPECVSNAECASHLACISLKCQDPCPGSCGINAECRVVSHTPNCICVSGFSGDPFRQCVVPQRKHRYSILHVSVNCNLFNTIRKYVHRAFQYSHTIIRCTSVVSGITVW